MHDFTDCKLCPMDTTTDHYGSISLTDWKDCPYPFRTNTEGSDGCPAVYISMSTRTSRIIWVTLGIIFILLLMYACKFDGWLCLLLLTFDNLLVPASTWDVISDINYITSTRIHSEQIFWCMLVSLLSTMFVFPIELIRTKRIYPMVLDIHYKLFPGFHYISSNLFYITSKAAKGIRPVIAVKDPKLQRIFSFYRPKDRFELEDEIKYPLSSLIALLNSLIHNPTEITNSGKSRKEAICDMDREQLIQELLTVYEDPDWNPLNIFPAGHDQPYKVCVHVVVVLVVWMLQIGNIMFFLIWPFVMLLRLVLCFCVMFFIASTKLVFTRDLWNIILYLWNPIEYNQNMASEFIDKDMIRKTKIVEAVVT